MKLTRKMENKEYICQSIQSGSALLKDALVHVSILTLTLPLAHARGVNIMILQCELIIILLSKLTRAPNLARQGSDADPDPHLVFFVSLSSYRLYHPIFV